MNYYGEEIISQKTLENGLIKIIVHFSYGATGEYHVTQEELDNANQ